jgi:hypothetical protein
MPEGDLITTDNVIVNTHLPTNKPVPDHKTYEYCRYGEIIDVQIILSFRSLSVRTINQINTRH